jgi:hypothetical protein
MPTTKNDRSKPTEPAKTNSLSSEAGQARFGPTLEEIEHWPAIIPMDDEEPRPSVKFALPGVSRDLLYRLAASGEIPTIKLGRRRMMLTSELLKMLGAQ